MAQKPNDMLNDPKNAKQYLDFFLLFSLRFVFNTASSTANQIPLCRRMLRPKPGLLRLRHCQSDALTSRLDLINIYHPLKIVNEELTQRGVRGWWLRPPWGGRRGSAAPSVGPPRAPARADTRWSQIFLKQQFFYSSKPVLRIQDIFVWIRILIHGSMPRTNRSGSCCFHHWPSRRQQKTNLKKFLLINFWGYIYIIFLKKKSKRSHKTSGWYNDPDPDPYLWLMDPDSDPGGQKTYWSDGSWSGFGSGSATLV